MARLDSWFNSHVLSFKTRGGARHFHALLSEGALGQVALSVLSQANSSDLRDLLGLSPGVSKETDYQVKQDGVVARSFWRYVLALAGRLAVLSLQYRMPPLVYVQLTCEEKRKDCLEDLAKMWEVSTLEETSLDDTACAAWLSTLGWPSQQWAREQLLSLAEDSFEQVCPSTVSGIEKYAGSILSTFPIRELQAQGLRVQHR